MRDKHALLLHMDLYVPHIIQIPAQAPLVREGILAVPRETTLTHLLSPSLCWTNLMSLPDTFDDIFFWLFLPTKIEAQQT